MRVSFVLFLMRHFNTFTCEQARSQSERTLSDLNLSAGKVELMPSCLAQNFDKFFWARSPIFEDYSASSDAVLAHFGNFLLHTLQNLISVISLDDIANQYDKLIANIIQIQ